MAYSFNTPQPPRRLWRRTALAAVLMAGTALGGFAVGHVSFAATDVTPGAPVNPPGSNPTGGQTLPDFTNLVGQVKPAVVSITTTLRTVASEDDGDQQQMPMPFRGSPFGGMGPHMHPQGHAVEARGSGFIVDANGTVVTNNHVVKDAKTVSVTLDDGTTAAGEGDRARRAHRYRGAEDRCPQAAALHSARQLREREAGPVGGRDGQPVRPRRIGHCRYRFGERPRHRRWTVRPVHPGRCADQPGQFGWAAVHPGRQGHRHEHRDPVALRRLGRHRLRHSVRHDPHGGRRSWRRPATSRAAIIGVRGAAGQRHHGEGDASVVEVRCADRRRAVRCTRSASRHRAG